MHSSLPRIFFARAIDGLDRSLSLSLATLVATELGDVGLLLVDAVATEPDIDSSADEYSRAKSIVEHDLRTLRSCDAVLMDMTLPGRNYIGCSCELVYAHMWQKPCVVYMGRTDRNRPWLTYHATAVFETRGEAISYLTKLLKGRLTAIAT